MPSPGTTPEPPGGDPRCDVSEILEPSCGVWWGASPWQGDPEPLERAADRKLDIVYTWNGIDQTEIPTDTELEYAEDGRIIHANIEAKRFNMRGHPVQDYKDILVGRFDRSLTAQAERIAELEHPVFVTFDHEADANKRYNRRGTPEEFVMAWRHIVDVYRENGADNAVWVWNVTGWPDNLSRLPRLWPGNEYVDWISWEAYNMTGCELMPHWDEVVSFEEALRPAYEWVQEEGPKHGIDPDKPVMIGEMGTVPIPGDPMATAKWYADIPQVLKRYERVKAVKMWDGKTAPTCDFRVGQDAYAQWGYGLAGRHPYVAVPERVQEIVDRALETKEHLRKVQEEVHGRPRRGE
ncbi:glycoside hydrolase family 26 protein [Nocardiopsis suaedae]|uniref:Glycosyl hydrolase n=1 Tax=Nocardiopsis suaedae TaxID=3018444 RepID=A0ABT4TPA0_9ACTN|nr:glycosyl hydrolase [Nocardiopsis suaedae]MDA2805977.1 glycosyl hydrolase [Nocardiopsis suaedae]